LRTRKIDFSKFSSIRIGPLADVKMLEKGDMPPAGHTIIGHANNILMGPNPPPLMMLSKDFDFIRIYGDRLAVGAATPTGKILSFCKKHDIGGFEYVAKLPGTVGGMLAMNAGVKSYETFDRLLSIRTEKGLFEKAEIPHGYRHAQIPGIAFEALFEIEKGFDARLAGELLALRKNQPSDPSAGSAFKNPDGDYAGRLIEAAGLKGARIGGMAFSPVHANFLINLENGTFQEALSLIDLAQNRVWKSYGIKLEPELNIIHNFH